MTKNIAYFLPRNTDEMELRQAAGPGEVFEVEENYINKSIKAITVYYGDLVCNAEESQYEPPPPLPPPSELAAEMHWEQGGPATDGAEEPAGSSYAPTTEQQQVAGAENGEGEKGEGGRQPPPAPPPLASPGTVQAGDDCSSDHQGCGQSVLSPTPTKQ